MLKKGKRRMEMKSMAKKAIVVAILFAIAFVELRLIIGAANAVHSGIMFVVLAAAAALFAGVLISLLFGSIVCSIASLFNKLFGRFDDDSKKGSINEDRYDRGYHDDDEW